MSAYIIVIIVLIEVGSSHKLMAEYVCMCVRAVKSHLIGLIVREYSA